MLISCPNCATSYNLDTAAIGDGRAVRCARCQVTWFAEPARQELALAAIRRISGPTPNMKSAVPLQLIRQGRGDGACFPQRGGLSDRRSSACSLAPLSDYDMPTIDIEPSQDIETIAARSMRPRPARRARDRRPLPFAALIILGCGTALAALRSGAPTSCASHRRWHLFTQHWDWT